MEQQRPVERSPESWGSRRWFQSCIVRPTTVSPRACSMPATTELSTPPDMATAMVGSGINGGGLTGCEPAEMGDALNQSFHKRVHLGCVIRAAQRNAQAGAGLFAGEADGGKNVRGFAGAAGASRAAGNGEAPQVESDQKRLGIDAVEPEVGSV